MIKRFLLLSVIICSLIVAGTTPHTVRAEKGISILESKVEIYFPTGLVFNIKAKSASNITKIRLHYEIDRMSYAQVTSESWPKFVPADTVKTRWVWDTRKAPLPPGANIRYWWTVEDAAGNRVQSPVDIATFEDLRYKWQSLTTPRLILFWYEGNQQFAQELLSASERALERLAADIGAHPRKPIKVYIYANSQDLRGAMIFPREWTGGVAYTEYSTIALGISQAQLDWGKRALAHELAHLVVHHVTFSPYGAILPTWLNEGLAMYAEGEPDPSLQKLLAKAVEEQRLISVRSLSSVFSAKTEQAYISYAQSDSIVRFLLQNYGKDRMFELLNLLRQGNTYDEALVQAYGFDMEELDTRWRNQLMPKTSTGREEATSPRPRHPAFRFGYFGYIDNRLCPRRMEIPTPSLAVVFLLGQLPVKEIGF